MTPPEGIYFPRPGLSKGWFFAILLLMGGAAAWLWNERREKPENQPRVIGVAEADSSGVIVTTDTAASPHPGEPIPSGTTPPATPDIFIAPPPNFQSPSTGTIGNFLEYARAMQFDPARGQDLQLPTDEFGRQPVVHLEPLTNLRRVDSLAFAQGRIIARLRSEVAVPSLGLRNGENLLWVRGTLGSTLPGEMWTTSALASGRQVTLAYSARAPAEIPQGKDAWLVSDEADGHQLWIVCGRGWCHN
jgi:hypothetical protein